LRGASEARTVNLSPISRRISIALLALCAVIFGLQRPAVATLTGTKANGSRATTVPSAPASPVMRTFSITKSGTALSFEYCSPGRVDQPNTAVRRLVVVVHGDSRNACDHAAYVQQAATSEGVEASTLIVAPRFRTDADVTAADSSLLYWSNGGWKSGSSSLSSPYSRPWTMSSFEVVDLLVQEVVNPTRFPNLANVVVVGHSAGGQFTNRYAAASRIGLVTATGPAYRFVVSNPSSYLYLDAQRYHAGVLGPLTAGEASACSGYDHYKYGLVSPYAYLRANDAAAIPSRYMTRSVVYLLGSADTDTADDSLDVSCEAKWQGSQRLERGEQFYRYLGQVLGTGVYSTHAKSIVPNVGHHARNMYTSVQGVTSLFR
jgi:pimeloyl-ACP methyl ester carboxylesterase